MSTVRAFKIGNATFNAAQASAERQKKLLLLVGGLVSANAGRAGATVIDGSLLVGSLLALPESVFDEVADIVLERVKVAGTDTGVSVRDFQGKQLDYFRLIAELVRWNLEDFFNWLVSEKSAGERASE